VVLVAAMLVLGATPAAARSGKPPKADEHAQAPCMIVGSLDRTEFPDPDVVPALIVSLDQSESKGAARQAKKLDKAGDSEVEQFNAISSGVAFWCKHKLRLECTADQCKGGRRVKSI
jgi:hypothetical protein